jgi:UPF0755 protein
VNSYRFNKKGLSLPRRVKYLVLGLLVVVVLGVVGVHFMYSSDLKPVSDSTTTQSIIIQPGSTLDQIAQLLQTDHLIKSAQAMEIYVAIHDERNNLQAGSYKISPNETVPEIVGQIAIGKVVTDLVTIVPGQQLSQISTTFIDDGFNASEVALALQADQYKQNYPAAADIPEGQSLEGFLYPDSYQKIATTDPHRIVEEALIEMQQQLTPSLLKAFASEGLTAYQGVTIASIVEKEVSSPTDRPQVAQVFLTRLKDNMPLGSDVTAYYGAGLAGVAPSVSYDSPYNTLLHNGLPPGPISTVSESSLQAVAHPANTNWLYFVSGDNGVTYFSTTLTGQQANTAEYCHTLCRSN